jgi:polyvinyl alcohol dehydrogenase (cytochrome)
MLRITWIWPVSPTRLRVILLVLAWTFCTGAQSHAESAQRSAELGKILYEQRCASCHDNATGRVPSTAALKAATPAAIMSALTDGAMSLQTKGLSLTDIMSIGNYVGGNKAGVRNAADWEAPRCTDRPPKMTLEGPQWNGWGRGAANLRYQPQPGLGAEDVPSLKPKWAIRLSGGRDGQPTVAGGRVFIASTSGAVYALNAATGCSYWRFDTAVGARTTITIGPLFGGKVPPRFAAYLMDYNRTTYALDAVNGRLLWKRKVDDQPGGIGTGSLALYGDRLFVPISSAEEVFAMSDTYPCCKSRGAVVALNAVTGKLLWKTYTTPIAPAPFKTNPKGTQMFGPAGGSIWSSPTIDPKRGVVYVGTGNSFTEVPHTGAESVMALDMATGVVRWHQQLTKNEPSVMGCYGAERGANCPSKLGPDHDFAASPMLVDLENGKQLLLAAQKSSQVYALDPDDGGKVVWVRRLSPGGPLGGVEFGPAVAESKIFVGISDIFVQQGAKPGLTALRIDDGEAIWQKESPALHCQWPPPYCSPAISQAVSAIPGVVFAGSMNGHLRAYAASDGEVIWDYDTSQVQQLVKGNASTGGVLDGGGPVIAGGMVYVVSGYAARQGSGSSLLIAFSVNGD